MVSVPSDPKNSVHTLLVAMTLQSIGKYTLELYKSTYPHSCRNHVFENQMLKTDAF